MEGAAKDDKEPPLLKIDPKCFQDALRTFFQPVKTDDPRLDFYTMYKKEATEYDTDYVKKYDEDLNTTLIFAGLFSAVSSAFVIDVHPNLQPDPNEQSAALLRAILLTLNQSALHHETPAVPRVWEDPQREIAIVASLMYASLMISLLAAFVAMLGKQWLSRYLRNSGGSMIERCGDRQRKCDGLKKWPLHFFIESLPVMLQVALLLLACGLCRHMWTVYRPMFPLVPLTLTFLTGLGVVFYIGIVIAGVSSYACPFQTPASIALRGPWEKIRRGIASVIVRSKQVLSRTHRMWERGFRSLLRRQSQPTTPLEAARVHRPARWLGSKDFAMIRRANTDDVQCVSWIFGNITDPEALDAALPLTGEIQWFDCGDDFWPIYDQIVTTFESCFDPTRTLYPGSRDRAYYSGRAMLWICTLAVFHGRTHGIGIRHIIPSSKYTAGAPDPDLEHLLGFIALDRGYGSDIEWLLRINTGCTALHSQWISNLLLYYSQTIDIEMDPGLISGVHEIKTTTPLNTKLNRLLTWCIFLGSPVESEMLIIQKKSGHVEDALYQLSKAVLSAIDGTPAQRAFIPHMLRDLIKLEYRPECLTEIVYEWCSVICEKRERLQDWEGPLLVCLEIGFRHLDFRTKFIEARLAHTKRHRGLVDVVFKSQESESIADLLHAWTAKRKYQKWALDLLGFCPAHLVGLHDLVPFSPRLRRLAIRSIEQIGYKGFEGEGAERFIGLLNHLHITVEDMDEKKNWGRLLLDTIQSSEGTQHLSHRYWKFLAEFTASEYLLEPTPMDPLMGQGTPSNSRHLRLDPAHSLHLITFLTEAKEWSKLECWVGIVWMLLPEELDPEEGDLGHSMTLLFRQQPGAAQKLKQWMEKWSRGAGKDIPDSFKQVHKKAHEAAQRDGPPISSANEDTEGPAHTPPPAPSQPSGNEFWELLSS